MTAESTVVVYSGGLDSTVLLTQAVQHSDPQHVVRAVSFNYGQRHGRKELHAARDVCYELGVAHDIIDVSSLATHLPGSSLTDDAVDVPEGHYAETTMAATVVPNRNLIMLSIAAGVAAAHDATTVATAVHAGDHPVYVDCRPEFIHAADLAIQAGTGGTVRLVAPFVDKTKTDIARLGADIGAPLRLSWSCYKGGDVHCGACGTCYERREAFREAKVTDPTVYVGTPTFATPHAGYRA